jgi:hypothetical protein
MSEKNDMPTREQFAKVIAQCAARLAWECENNMPETMIECERQLLLKKLIAFPVDRTAQHEYALSEKLARDSELECLERAGYFEDGLEVGQPDGES